MFANNTDTNITGFVDQRKFDPSFFQSGHIAFVDLTSDSAVLQQYTRPLLCLCLHVFLDACLRDIKNHWNMHAYSHFRVSHVMCGHACKLTKVIWCLWRSVFSKFLNSFTLSDRSHTIKMHPDDDYHFNLLFISILFAIHAGAASVLNPDTFRYLL